MGAAMRAGEGALKSPETGPLPAPPQSGGDGNVLAVLGTSRMGRPGPRREQGWRPDLCLLLSDLGDEPTPQAGGGLSPQGKGLRGRARGREVPTDGDEDRAPGQSPRLQLTPRA